MNKLVINGPAVLSGEVEVRGAKNATLPILAAAAAGSEPVVLRNLPDTLNDIRLQVDALTACGASVQVSDGVATVDSKNMTGTCIPPEISGKSRGSLLILGALLGRNKKAEIAFPGGCKLGERKLDLHLHGLRSLGAQVDVGEETITVTADKLTGTDISFYLPSTTATELIMIAACFAEGRTRIFNAHTRPEVVDMAACLNSMGANIRVQNRVVEIEGGRPLGGADHSIMPAWDEALTYIAGAGVTGGEVCVRNFGLSHIRSDVEYMKVAGMDVFEWGGNVYASGKNASLKAFDLFTAPYPGVNSDLQPIFAVLASQCAGESTITDQRFTERFQYISELKKLGVNIDSYGNCAVINGPSKLTGAPVSALDLRCGAALVLAALAAEGETIIDNCYQLGRGYEFVVERLTALGAKIRSE